MGLVKYISLIVLLTIFLASVAGQSRRCREVRRQLERCEQRPRWNREECRNLRERFRRFGCREENDRPSVLEFCQSQINQLQVCSRLRPIFFRRICEIPVRIRLSLYNCYRLLNVSSSTVAPVTIYPTEGNNMTTTSDDDDSTTQSNSGEVTDSPANSTVGSEVTVGVTGDDTGRNGGEVTDSPTNSTVGAEVTIGVTGDDNGSNRGVSQETTQGIEVTIEVSTTPATSENPTTIS